MDETARQFRRRVIRELGDRQGAERRYSRELRQAAVAYWLDALAPLAIHYPPIGKDSAKDLEDGRDLAAWLAGGLEAAATPAAVGAAA